MHAETDIKKTKQNKGSADSSPNSVLYSGSKAKSENNAAVEVPYETSKRVLIAAASSQSTMQRKR